MPAANLLGEIGKGHKVAFNVLNFGRLKLGAMCTGGCKTAIGESAKYAASRRQFGQPIATFGAIRHKLGEMTARTYALEALMYRTAGVIDQHMAAAGGERHLALLAALEEFAVEASIAKVAGSEVLDFVLDENVQIHGGNGFVRDYPAERHYRDARVNRIFEGTNEINRLLIPGMLMKRALKGELALIPAAKRLMDEVMSPAPPSLDAGDGAPLGGEARAVDSLQEGHLPRAGRGDAALRRQAAGRTGSAAVAGRPGHRHLRGRKRGAARAGGRRARRLRASHEDAARTFVSDASLRVEMTARQVLAAIAEGDVLRTNLAALRRLLKTVPADTVSCTAPAGRRDCAAWRVRVRVAAEPEDISHRDTEDTEV